VVYPGAVHQFEYPNAITRRYGEGHPMQWSPEAGPDSFGKVHAFLDRTIGPAS
jgi:hypothetical protein